MDHICKFWVVSFLILLVHSVQGVYQGLPVGSSKHQLQNHLESFLRIFLAFPKNMLNQNFGGEGPKCFPLILTSLTNLSFKPIGLDNRGIDQTGNFSVGVLLETAPKKRRQKLDVCLCSGLMHRLSLPPGRKKKPKGNNVNTKSSVKYSMCFWFQIRKIYTQWE